MLMVGVTLSLGSVVVAAALGSMGQAEGSASLGAAVHESASGVQLSLVFVSVAPSGACPTQGGAEEGTSATLALFDYGSTGFAPAELMVNSTFYPGSYAPLSPGKMQEYPVLLAECAHPSGLTVLAVDAAGDEVQVGS